MKYLLAFTEYVNTIRFSVLSTLDLVCSFINLTIGNFGWALIFLGFFFLQSTFLDKPQLKTPAPGDRPHG